MVLFFRRRDQDDGLIEHYRQNGRLVIQPFEYKQERIDKRALESWIRAPDPVFLEFRSTSPLVEPPHFVSVSKRVLSARIEHPNPRSTLFINGCPRVWSLKESGWVLEDGRAAPGDSSGPLSA